MSYLTQQLNIVWYTKKETMVLHNPQNCKDWLHNKNYAHNTSFLDKQLNLLLIISKSNQRST
jgi:hypothetical protein